MKFTYREYMFHILNGISMGVIVALIPSALLGQLMQALSGIWPGFSSSILTITTFNMSLLPAMAAFSVGYLCRMNMVQMSSLAGAAMVGSGVMHQTAQGFLLAGTGDVINTGITITFAVWLARLVGERFKNYTVLLLPIIVIVGAGAFGLFTLPYVQAFTGLIGAGIKTFTELQPLLMGILMGITFAVLICSPISSVGIATAIGITGIASGSANLGITAGAFTLAIMGSSVNSLGTVFAHFLGIINAALVENYYNQIKAISETTHIPMPEDWFATLLRMPDVLTKVDVQELSEEGWEVVRQVVEEAISHLVDFRKQEGAALEKKFNEKIDNIESLLKSIEPYETDRKSVV